MIFRGKRMIIKTGVFRSPETLLNPFKIKREFTNKKLP